MLAQELLRTGRLHEAIETTGKGLERDPKDADLLLMHGLALAEAGQLETAQLALTRAAKLEPDWIEPWRRLAALLLERGKLERALQVVARAETIDPVDEILVDVRHQVTLQLRAHAYVESADPHEEPTMLARELLAAGKAELAFEVTRMALTEELDDEDLLTTHARAAIATGDLDEALSVLETASFEAPDWVDVWLLLAEVRELRGEIELGREAAEEGLEIDPGHPGLVAVHARLETLVTL
jgi:Flp pilus assembly protein TadD